MPQTPAFPVESESVPALRHLSPEKAAKLQAHTFPSGKPPEESFQMMPPALQHALGAERRLHYIFTGVRKRERRTDAILMSMTSHSEGLANQNLVDAIDSFVASYSEWSKIAHSLLRRVQSDGLIGARREAIVFHLAQADRLMAEVTPLSLATQEHFRQLIELAVPTLDNATAVRVMFTPLMRERDAVFATPTVASVERYLETLDVLLLSRYFEGLPARAATLREYAARSRGVLEATALMEQAFALPAEEVSP